MISMSNFFKFADFIYTFQEREIVISLRFSSITLPLVPKHGVLLHLPVVICTCCSLVWELGPWHRVDCLIPSLQNPVQCNDLSFSQIQLIATLFNLYFVYSSAFIFTTYITMCLSPLYLFVFYWIEFLKGETLCLSPLNPTPSTVPGT